MEIQGYPNYLIYRDGSIQNKTTRRLMSKTKDKDGYNIISLYRKTLKVHRLVAQTYIPNPEHKNEVDHIDRRKTNNNVSNLRWVTRQENMANIGERCDNTSGHKYISYNKNAGRWRFQAKNDGVMISRCFKNKTEALTFKYIFLLKLKSGIGI